MSEARGRVRVAALRLMAALMLAATLVSGQGVLAQSQQRRARPPAGSRVAASASAMTGVYRIDIPGSDKLYTVVAGASSNLPFREQQRFFIDLAVRLTPPDLLAIERRGRRITIGSSRAPRFTFEADGITRTENAADGHVVRSRAVLDGDTLMFTSDGRTDDNFSVTFASVDNGRRLRVTRRISAAQLNEPVVIQTFYNKVSDVAVWNIYGETQITPARATTTTTAAAATTITNTATTNTPNAAATTDIPPTERAGSDDANVLRQTLDQWLDATNARDIEKQLTFYVPEVKAYYLARNVSRAFVRAEKRRVFSNARTIEIRAEAPEIVFLDAARTAVMRFRKQYALSGAARTRRGEVVQELRWTRTPTGWKIFSERDIRVIR